MPIAATVSSAGSNSMNGNGLASSANPADPGSPAALPQALQNLQRLLQTQLANVNPLHLQQALQRQQVRLSLFVVVSPRAIVASLTFIIRQMGLDFKALVAAMEQQRELFRCRFCVKFYCPFLLSPLAANSDG